MGTFQSCTPGEGGASWGVIPIPAACCLQDPLPTSCQQMLKEDRLSRRLPSTQGCIVPSWEGVMPPGSVSVLACILASGCQSRSDITSTSMTVSQEWFSLKTRHFWERFLFCRWKMWRLFSLMGGSQEDGVRICDETQNDWHMNVARSN